MGGDPRACHFQRFGLTRLMVVSSDLHLRVDLLYDISGETCMQFRLCHGKTWPQQHYRRAPRRKGITPGGRGARSSKTTTFDPSTRKTSVHLLLTITVARLALNSASTSEAAITFATFLSLQMTKRDGWCDFRSLPCCKTHIASWTVRLQQWSKCHFSAISPKLLC